MRWGLISRTLSAPWTPTTVGIERKHSRVGSLTDGSFYDARVVRGRARADAQAAARGLEEASRGHGLVCGLFVSTKPARVCLATEKKI